MKNKFNLDMMFLYQEPLKRDYIVLDNDTEYDEWFYKYEKEEDKYCELVKQCSFNDLVYLFIRPFIEKYPRVYKIAFSVSSNYECIDGYLYKYKKFNRNDVLKFETESEIGPIKNEFLPEDRDIYDKKITVEFTESINQNTIVDALEGKEFTKSKKNDSTNYLVKNSPIDYIEVYEKKMVIYINPKMVIYY